MSSNTFDRKDFILHYESAFTVTEIGNALHNFLKTEVNEDPWLFLRG